jgi:hypothetical protein
VTVVLNVGLGAALAIIALTAQYLIKKRIKNQKLARVYAWIVWIPAALGGEAISSSVHNTVGITSAGAAVVSVIGLLFLIVDIADRRPDWPAFIITVSVPWFMRLTGGTLGALFDLALAAPHAANGALGTFMGI